MGALIELAVQAAIAVSNRAFVAFLVVLGLLLVAIAIALVV